MASVVPRLGRVVVMAYLASCAADVPSTSSTGYSTIESSTSSSSDASAGTTSTTEANTTTSSSGASTSSGSSDTDACDEIQAPMPDWECNPWGDDCPPGTKCHSVEIEIARCVPLAVQPIPVGEPCRYDSIDADPCVGGAFCFQGRCHELCTCSELDPTCSDPCSACHLSDSSAARCVLPCDPFGDPCPTGRCEYDTQGFSCGAAANDGQIGDPCYSLSDCDIGLTCDGPGWSLCDAPGCCAPLCHAGDDVPCVAALGPGALCEPLFENGQGRGCPWQDVGVCVVQR